MNLASLPVKQGHFQGKSKEAQTCLYGWDEIAVNSEENLKHMPGWAQSMPPGGGRGRTQLHGRDGHCHSSIQHC